MRSINFNQVFAGQAVGLKEVHDDIWLVSFMDYDLGYFDLEARVLEPLENQFGPKVLPMSPERSVTHVSGTDRERLVGPSRRFSNSSGDAGWPRVHFSAVYSLRLRFPRA